MLTLDKQKSFEQSTQQKKPILQVVPTFTQEAMEKVQQVQSRVDSNNEHHMFNNAVNNNGSSVSPKRAGGPCSGRSQLNNYKKNGSSLSSDRENKQQHSTLYKQYRRGTAMTARHSSSGC